MDFLFEKDLCVNRQKAALPRKTDDKGYSAAGRKGTVYFVPVRAHITTLDEFNAQYISYHTERCTTGEYQGVRTLGIDKYSLGTDKKSMGTDKYTLGIDKYSFGTDKKSMGTDKQVSKASRTARSSKGGSDSLHWSENPNLSGLDPAGLAAR